MDGVPHFLNPRGKGLRKVLVRVSISSIILVIFSLVTFHSIQSFAYETGDSTATDIPVDNDIIKDVKAKDIVNLEKMVVYSKRFASYTPSTKVIVADSIEGKNRDLPDVLKSISGVVVNRTGGFGQYSTTSIRGCGSNQVQVYLDGLPLNSAQSGTVDISKIPLGALNEITVYKTSSPLILMGENAGGVIFLSTDSDKDIVAGNLELGSFWYCKAGAMLAKTTGKTAHKITIDYAGSENNFPYLDLGLIIHGPYSDTDDVVREMDNSYVTSFSAFYNNKYCYDETHSLFSQLSYSYNSEGIFSYLTPDTNDGYIKSKEIAFIESYDVELASNLNINVNVSGRYLKKRLQRLAPFYLGEENKFETTYPFLQAQVLFGWIVSDNISAKLLASGSVDGYMEDNLWIDDTGDMPEFYRLQARGGIEFEYNRKEKIGARIKYTHRYEIDTTNGYYDLGGFQPGGSSSSSHNPSAEAELRFQINPLLCIYSSGRYSSRSPSFYEKYTRSSKIHGAEIQGYTDLKNEKRLEYDLGISLENEKFSSTIAFFQGKTKDKIKFLLRTQGLFVPENLEEMHTIGVEWDAHVKIRKWFSITNSLTYMHNIIKSEEIPRIDGNDEPMLPRFKDYLDLCFYWGQFHFGHSFYYSSGYYIGLENGIKVGAKQPELGAYLKYTGISLLTLTYRIENYLNYLNYDFYNDLYKQPKPGRTHYISVGMDITKLKGGD